MYKVTYTIDIDAPTPLEAAKKAHEIIRKQVGPVFEVDAPSGHLYKVDLEQPDRLAVTRRP